MWQHENTDMGAAVVDQLRRLVVMCRVLNRKAGQQTALLPTLERSVGLLADAAQLAPSVPNAGDTICNLYRQAALTLGTSFLPVLGPALEQANFILESTGESHESHRLLAVCFGAFEVTGVEMPEAARDTLAYALWKSWEATAGIIRAAGEQIHRIPPDIVLQAFASYAKCISAAPAICAHLDAMVDATKVAAIMFPLVQYGASMTALFRFLQAVSTCVAERCSADAPLACAFGEAGPITVRGIMVMVSGATGTSRSMLPRAAGMLQHLVEVHPRLTGQWLSDVMATEPYSTLPPESMREFQRLLKVEDKHKYERTMGDLAAVIRKHVKEHYR